MLTESCCTKTFYCFRIFLICVFCTTTNTTGNTDTMTGESGEFRKSFQSAQESFLLIAFQGGIKYASLKLKTWDLASVGKTGISTMTLVMSREQLEIVFTCPIWEKDSTPTYLLRSERLMGNELWGRLPWPWSRLLCSVRCPWQHNRRLWGLGEARLRRKEWHEIRCSCWTFFSLTLNYISF